MTGAHSAELVAELHARHRRPGSGTVALDELGHIADLVAEHRPRSFLEIGTASGLSAGLVAHLLEGNGGERLVTVDLSDRFFADPELPTGFLLREVYPDGPVSVAQHTGMTAADVPGLGEEFDLAFVDANHEHPWPILDTLCVQPVLRGPRLVLQHDLTLYRRQAIGKSVGPKLLLDQFPESHREVFPANGGNLGLVSLDLPRERLELIARDALTIPWTLSRRLQDDVLSRLRGVLAASYSRDLLEVFETCVAKYNQPNGSYMRPRRKGRGRAAP